MTGMKTYVVGGAVRDSLLGLPVRDRDHVVVGATPSEMLALGYLAVGKDFPVFLHPETREEYALARTERKTAPGYAGFAFHAAPEITLEQDLQRRDLTINAIAQADDGQLIDPYGGCDDLHKKWFRHVSPAFSEDPVRILRVARFAARFTEFRLAPETLALMQHMVASGEVDALVPERVWQELSRGLIEQQPSRMFELLRDCGALAHILPEMGGVLDTAQPKALEDFASLMRTLDFSATRACGLSVRFALWALGIERSMKAGEALCTRLKIPNEHRDLALMALREYKQIAQASHFSAAELVSLLARCDALRKPERFSALLQVCECDASQILGQQALESLQTKRLQQALQAMLSVDAGAIAARVMTGSASSTAIAQAVQEARIAAVERMLFSER